MLVWGGEGSKEALPHRPSISKGTIGEGESAGDGNLVALPNCLQDFLSGIGVASNRRVPPEFVIT